MASLVHEMRLGHKGAIKKDPAKLPKSGFIQAPTSSEQEIRRAGEQTSPQVARAAGHPRKAGRGRRLISGSRSIAVSLSKTGFSGDYGEAAQSGS